LAESFFGICLQNADLMGIFYCKTVVVVPHPRYNTRLFCLPTFIGNIMVVIRLSRGGAKKRPFFNIVATDSRNRRDGRFIERIGFYNPIATGGEVAYSVAQDRLAYWQGVGAQLSPTVARLVAQAPKAAA
jgi:small subunit ribosomal protein S16